MVRIFTPLLLGLALLLTGCGETAKPTPTVPSKKEFKNLAPTPDSGSTPGKDH